MDTFTGDIGELFQVLGAYKGFTRDTEWAEFLNYQNPSSISRLRKGKQKLTGERIQKIVDGFPLSRSELDRGGAYLARKLGVDDRLPATLADVSGSSRDVDTRSLAKIAGKFTLVYLGRGLGGDFNCIISEALIIDRELSGNGEARKDVSLVDHHTLGRAISGEILSYNRTLHLTLGYNDEFPSSNILLRPLLLTKEMNIFSGIYLDISEEASPIIFATQCYLFTSQFASSFPREINEEQAVRKMERGTRQQYLCPQQADCKR